MSSLPIDATHLKAVLSPPPPSFSFHAVSDPIMSDVIHCCSVLWGGPAAASSNHTRHD